MVSTRCLSKALLVLSISISFAPPAAGQGVGAIAGTIMDSSGAVLPGAAVTLSSTQGTLGSNQEAVADARGAYQFIRLVPGIYIVRAQLAGFRTAEQQNIAVTADQTARADLLLTLGPLEEGVVVSGAAPMLDTTSALRQTSLSQEILEALPNRIDVWSITRVIPSVVVSKVDVGGSESFQQSGITVHGTNTEGGYYIDGMDVSHMDGAGAGATFYIDPYAYAENNFMLGNSPAESPRGGLVFNMISRTGTNQFHGGTDFAGMNAAMGFQNVSGALENELLRSVPAGVRAARPDLKATADIRYLYDTGMWLAGPIKQDKLWFSTSLHYQRILQYLLSFNPDGSQVPDDNDLFNSSSKLAWQVNRSSQFSYFYTIQHKVNGHRASTSMFSESGATTRNIKLPQVHQLKWTSTASSRLVFDVSGSVFRVEDTFMWPKEGDTPSCIGADNRANSIACTSGFIAGFDQVTNTLLRILPTYSISQMRRTVVQGSVGYFTTAHDIRGGVQLNHGSLSPYRYSSSGMRAVYRDGVPDSVNTYNTPNYSHMKDREMAYYAQDRWRPTRKLTLNIGVRAETNYGWMNAACQPQTQFIDATCYAPLKGFPDWIAVNPRFSVVYDVGGDGRTALKFAANRYITPVGKSVVERVNPINLVSDTRRWTECSPGQTSACDLNRDRLPQLNELGPSSGYPLGVRNRYAPDTDWPWSRELSAEVQRQFPGNLVATVGYTHREKLGQLGSRNMAVPTNSYIPMTVTEVNSSRSVTVFNQAPGLRGEFDVLWANEAALDSTYNGTDVTLQKRLSEGWMLMGGISVGKNIGDIYAAADDLNNPNFQFRRGVQGNDVPFSLRLSGIYELPYRVTLSATYQRQSGFPEITSVSVGNNTIPLTQGTTTITVDPRGTARLPDLNQLDFSLRKPFRMGNKMFAPRFDAYNLLNNATVTGRTTTLGPNYYRVNSIQRGAMVKLGMNVDF